MEVSNDIQERVAQEFLKRYPEFYGSEKNAALLREGVERLTEAEHPFSADTLALAFHYLNAGGRFEEPGPEVEEINDAELVRRHHIESLAKNAEKMSDFELEKSLLSAGIYVTRRGTI